MGECDGGGLMATTTPNFGWSVPTSTDYVKDGAVAIETLGDSIDASLVDLKGGTTGQVLSKNTNTDMDFTWVTPNDADAIQNTIVDAKGDLITATAADTPARLAVGTNGQVLTADSTEATGLKWATSGGWTPDYQLINTGGTSLSGTTVTISGISGKNALYILVTGASANGNDDSNLYVRFNSDTNNNYLHNGLQINGSGTTTRFGTNGTSLFEVGQLGLATDTWSFSMHVMGTDKTGYKPVEYACHFTGSNSASRARIGTGAYTGTSAITSVTFFLGTNSFDAGTIYVYGA